MRVNHSRKTQKHIESEKTNKPVMTQYPQERQQGRQVYKELEGDMEVSRRAFVYHWARRVYGDA